MANDSTPDTADGPAQDASEQLPLAPPSHRVAARIIDGFIIGIPVTLNRRSSWRSPADEGWIVDFTLFTLIFLAIWVTYEVTLVATKGQTLGKMLMGITVLRVDNGIVPGWRRSLKRWAPLCLLFLIPYAGPFLALLCYASPLWSRNRQGWHDRFAGTCVVTTGPAPPYTSTRSNPAQDSREPGPA